jgi:acetyltransferase-like isoleucine patch superfamily enzyme
MFLDNFGLKRLGLKSYGKNVLISDKASFYGNSEISIGNNVRIDDFCILSGNITLGNNIHIGAYSALYGKFGIVMEDFTGLSPRCTVFSATDDFSGDYLISPMNPKELCNVQGGKVIIESFAHICSHSVIMPGLRIREGVVIGAMSFVKIQPSNWEIWAGNPLRRIGRRNLGIVSQARKINEL